MYVENLVISVVYLSVSLILRNNGHGFSYVRWKPRNEQLAQMGSFHQSKRSDNKQYAVEVRWGILTYF